MDELNKSLLDLNRLMVDTRLRQATSEMAKRIARQEITPGAALRQLHRLRFELVVGQELVTTTHEPIEYMLN